MTLALLCVNMNHTLQLADIFVQIWEIFQYTKVFRVMTVTDPLALNSEQSMKIIIGIILEETRESPFRESAPEQFHVNLFCPVL